MSQTDTPISTENSYFDGNFWQRLGWIIVSRFLTVITLGLAYPAAVCMLLRWECKHTVINGRRLKFTGTGAQLFGKYILWWLLTIVTFGIFSIWLGLNMKKWTVKHTVYADDNTGAVSRFTGGVGGYLGIRLLAGILTVFTFSIGGAWGKRMILNWDTKHTYISGTHLGFTGRGGQLFGKYLLWGLLTVVTLSIFALFIPIKFLKWQYKHTGATPVAEVPGEKKAGIGVIIGIITACLAVFLIIGAVILLFFPRASIALPDHGQNLPAKQVMFVLNDAGMLAPAMADARQLPGNFESTVDYTEIEGEAFSFALDSALIPAERQNEEWIQTYFTASGKISSTAYLDTDSDILYLDYGVESANCTTYLSLDGSQTGTGHAQPLTQIVSAGKGIHSVAYPYDTAPEYVYVMAFAHVADTSVSNTGTADDGTYYFVTLHKQPLDVVIGTPDDLDLTDPENNILGNPDSSSLIGSWIGCSKAPYDTSAPDGTPATGMTCLHWNIEADGTFAAYYMGYGNFGSSFMEMYNPVKHVGTWELSGSTMTVRYEYIDYPAEEPSVEDDTVETYTVSLENGKLVIDGHPDCRLMLKDATADDVYEDITGGASAPDASTSDMVGQWVILSKPRANSVPDTSYAAFADAGCYEFRPDGTFSLSTLTLAAENGSWFQLGGSEKSYEGTYQQNGNILALHYTTTYKGVWSDDTQDVEFQPVAIDETEQLNILPGVDNMLSATSLHPRFGEICLFQRVSEVETYMGVLMGHLAFDH